MIRIRQIKIPVEKDNLLEIKNRITKIIKCNIKDILDIKI